MPSERWNNDTDIYTVVQICKRVAFQLHFTGFPYWVKA